LADGVPRSLQTSEGKAKHKRPTAARSPASLETQWVGPG